MSIVERRWRATAILLALSLSLVLLVHLILLVILVQYARRHTHPLLHHRPPRRWVQIVPVQRPVD